MILPSESSGFFLAPLSGNTRSGAENARITLLLRKLFPVRCRTGVRVEPFSLCGGGRVFFCAMSLKLLTVVWEKAPYKDGALLLLLALADWSDDDGLAWPSVEGLAFKARMGERHARRILRTFEADGFVTVEQRGTQHRPNSYRISVAKLLALPERLYCPPCESDRTPVSVQTGHGSPPEGVRIAPDPSGTVIEPSPDEIEERENTPDISSEGAKFVVWFISLLKDTGAPVPRLTESIRAMWADNYDKLIRIDGREKKEIAQVCRWARADHFWRSNFLSPMKLRERKDGVSRYDLFLCKLKNHDAPLNGHTVRSEPIAASNLR